MTDIGKLIKSYREKKNLTQQELAVKARLGTKSIEKYESGEQIPDTQTALKISTVLDLPASELLEHEYTVRHDIDQEIIQLITELGHEKAKVILRKFKELNAEDYTYIMQKMYELNHVSQYNDKE